MNVKTHALAIASALAVSVAAISAASAGVIVPANFAQGTLTAIDVAKNTVSVDGTTYAVDRATDIETSLGGQVDLTYMVVDGKLHALWIQPTDTAVDTDMADTE